MSLLETIAVIVGVVSGVSGLVLGILNYIHQRISIKPRLVVQPSLMDVQYRILLSRDDPQPERSRVTYGIMEIHNVGQIPVVGSHIGFLGKHRQDAELLIDAPESLNGCEWPGEIKPQHTAMLRFELQDLPDTNEIGRAVAVTAVGDMFKASRRDMRRFAKQRKALSTPSPAT